MRSNTLGLIVLGLIAGSVSASEAIATELAVAITPADGTGMLLKRFHVDGPTEVSGVSFGSNDTRTTFPEVSLLAIADGTIENATVLASALNVSPSSAGTVQVTWETPARLESSGDYYVAIRMPAGDIKRGPGDGAGVKAASEGVGNSFGAISGEGEFAPLGVELETTVISTPLSGSLSHKAGPSPDEKREAVQPAFLKAHSQGGESVLRISFGVPHVTRGSLEIYDVAGRRVRTLARDGFTAGIHVVDWDGRNERGFLVASGVYVARLVLDVTTLTRKLILAR